jgi:hypothetical protein
MEGIERDLKRMFERRSSDVALSGQVPTPLRNRARLQRLVTVSSGLFLAVLTLTGGFVALRHIAPDRGPVTHISKAQVLKVPPRSLRHLVSKGYRQLINRDLVLLYKDGDGYIAYSEGIFPLICPPNSAPRACVTTAQRTPIPKGGWPGRGTHWAFQKNSNELSLPHLDPKVEVLWRGTPKSGSIGINSPSACDRSARFRPDFTCKGGVPAFHSHPATGSTTTGNQGTDACPNLLPPGHQPARHARETAAAWAHKEKTRKSTGFTVKVAQAHGLPQGPCRGSVWRRTWVGTVQWEFPPGSPAAHSASLASSTIFEGRTRSGWRVWLQFH